MISPSFFESLSDPGQWSLETKNQLIRQASNVTPLPEVRGDLVFSDSPTLFPGSLVVNGNVEVRNSFLVLGDLDVSGAIWSEQKPFRSDPPTPVVWIIAGNLHCRGLLPSCTDYLLVAGKILAADCILAENCPRIVCMGLETRLFYGDIADNRIKLLEAGKHRKVRAKHKIPMWHFTDPTYDSTAVTDVLVPDVIQWCEEKFWGSYAAPSFSRVLDRIRTGQSIFKYTLENAL